METISSFAKGMTNDPYKGRGFAHVTHFVWTTVDLERFSTALRRAPLVAIHNSPPTDYSDRKYGAYIRPKLHRFDLSPYVLQSWLYNI